MPSNNRKKLTPHRLGIREKELRCLELRMAGLPWDQISTQVGYASASSAYRAVTRLMEERTVESTDKMRQMETMRLDRMLQALWPRALEGKWLAIDRILKIQERKAALEGLDAPQRRIVNVITPEAFQAALQERERTLHELRSAVERNGGSIDKELEEIDREVVAELEAGEESITDAEVVSG